MVHPSLRQRLWCFPWQRLVQLPFRLNIVYTRTLATFNLKDNSNWNLNEQDTMWLFIDKLVTLTQKSSVVITQVMNNV